MPKISVFVACPYMLFPLDDYKKVFQSISKEYQISFRFADEQITNEHVLEKIRKYILDSDFSLFDITGWNANVTLELGLAAGLGKKYFILLNNKLESNDAPSDIKGIDRIQYSSNSELEAKLKILVKQELPDEKQSSNSVYENIKIRIVDLLTTNPGLGLSRASDMLQEDKYLVQSVLRSMAQSGELKTKGAKKGTTYFTPETDLRKHRGKGKS